MQMATGTGFKDLVPKKRSIYHGMNQNKGGFTPDPKARKCLSVFTKLRQELWDLKLSRTQRAFRPYQLEWRIAGISTATRFACDPHPDTQRYLKEQIREFTTESHSKTQRWFFSSTVYKQKD